MVFLALGLVGCATATTSSAHRPAKAVQRTAECTPARATEAERRAARLELQEWGNEAVIEDLHGRLDEALQEVVRAMAKLQSLATRAEAASAMAEADLALKSQKGANADASEIQRARRLMQESAAEFKRQNYGGALYLANQAKAAGSRPPRATGNALTNLRAGETPFLVPVKLRTTVRANLREGPGTNYTIVTPVDPGTGLDGLSYYADWVRVTSPDGREGWIAHSLLARRAGPAH